MGLLLIESSSSDTMANCGPSKDLYCYLCDDSVLDSKLTEHLAAFGIEVGSQQKTEKSMAELVR